MEVLNTQCVRHQFELAQDICRGCGYEFCSECIVYAFGPDEPPFCVSCALTASGVRSNTGRPALPKREIRRRLKERHLLTGRGKEPEKIEVQAVEIDWSIPDDQATETTAALDWVNEHVPSTGERVPF